MMKALGDEISCQQALVAFHSFDAGDYGDAFPTCVSLAEEGSAAAQFRLGYMYLNGLGAELNPQSARRWLEKAAEQGHLSAQYELAKVYEHGAECGDFDLEVSKDVLEAEKWYRLAADQGLLAARRDLGQMLLCEEDLSLDDSARLHLENESANFEEGRSFVVSQFANELGHWTLAEAWSAFELRDFSFALSILESAGKAGSRSAQYRAGMMYLRGQGTPYDPDRAIRWIRMSAHLGHANAQYQLGQMHQYGWATPSSDWGAERWFRRAAEQGHAEAQYMLARLLLSSLNDGSGVERDVVEGYMWQLLALRHLNEPDRIHEASVLTPALSPLERSEAEHRAQRWQPSLPKSFAD